MSSMLSKIETKYLILGYLLLLGLCYLYIPKSLLLIKRRHYVGLFEGFEENV